MANICIKCAHCRVSRGNNLVKDEKSGISIYAKVYNCEIFPMGMLDPVTGEYLPRSCHEERTIGTICGPRGDHWKAITTEG